MKLDSPAKLQHIWWIKPNTLIGMAILPLYVLIGAITEKLGNLYYWASFILIFCLYLGCQTLAVTKIRKTETITFCKKSSQTILNYLFLISLVGYFVWFFEIIKNPILLVNALSTEGRAF